MNGGERSWTIDEVPLEWCFQPAVKLDFRHFADGYVATAADVEAELKRIGHELQPLDIVVVNTSAGAKYGRPDYVPSGCGMGAEATLYLLERGVRLTGTDGWSWDAPFVHTAKRYAETRDARLIWEGHKAGRHIGYCHIEKLHNLESLPPHGFMIACFPVKIARASAGWTRAVAIFDSSAPLEIAENGLNCMARRRRAARAARRRDMLRAVLARRGVECRKSRNWWGSAATTRCSPASASRRRRRSSATPRSAGF